MILLIIGFTKVKSYNATSLKEIGYNHFSVIIPFRNEENNIEKLLHSLTDLKYPNSHFEVILVDDFSTDETQKKIINFIKDNCLENYTLISNSNEKGSAKKRAISEGIKTSNFDWIISTDADCIVPNNWLYNFDTLICNNNPNLICGPVNFTGNSSFLSIFQQLNSLGLLGATIGSFGLNSPIMCNGANMCYRKDVFYQANGFANSIAIASGDDVFLLENFLKIDSTKVVFAKEKLAIVATSVENDLKSFFEQQIRWGSKSKNYRSLFAKLISIIVFLSNLFIVIGLGSVVVNKLQLSDFLIIFSVKILLDIVLITQTKKFLEKRIHFIAIFFSSLLYPFFITWIGILSQIKNVTWKGRVYN